jgi:hypothetical protein
MSASKKNPPPRPPSSGVVTIEHPPPPPKPPPPPDPLPIADELTAAAKAFRDLFDTNNATYHLLGGQFSVPDVMREQLRGKIFGIQDSALLEELLNLIRGSSWDTLTEALRSAPVRISQAYQKALPAGDVDKSKPIGAVKSKQTVGTTQAYRAATAHARELMAGVSAADKTLAREVLDDNTATGDWAYGAVNQWLNKPTIGPHTFDKVSLPRQAAVWVNSLVMCGDTAEKTAGKLLNTRVNTQGFDPASLPAFAKTTLSGLTQTDSRSTEHNLMLAYQSAPLQAAMDKATALLTAGGYLVAGCLSGKEYQKGQHPFPEHYILLFAAQGNRYLYWDPDTTTTDIDDLRTKLRPAIGILVHDTSDPAHPTFTTGFDFADLSTINGDYHTAHPKRHRYQVATLEKKP